MENSQKTHSNPLKACTCSKIKGRLQDDVSKIIHYPLKAILKLSRCSLSRENRICGQKQREKSRKNIESVRKISKEIGIKHKSMYGIFSLCPGYAFAIQFDFHRNACIFRLIIIYMQINVDSILKICSNVCST